MQAGVEEAGAHAGERAGGRPMSELLWLLHAAGQRRRVCLVLGGGHVPCAIYG